MSARIPTRRIGQSALSVASRASAQAVPSSPALPVMAMRHLSLNPLKKSKAAAKTPNLENPILANLLAKRERQKASEKPIERPEHKPGALSKDTSIFKPEYEIEGFRDDLDPADKASLKVAEKEKRAHLQDRHAVHLSSQKLDPDPLGRQLWEQRMVIRSLRRRGRLTKDLELARTERQSLFRSQNLPTSVKKLTKIMNQVQGKTVEEALVQLRFSKKRVARDVVKGLMIARDEAIVARGMGLGDVLPIEEGKETDAVTNAEKEHAQLMAGQRRKAQTGTPTNIELKDGSRKKVYDQSEIYIDQAWVGKGEQWKSPEFRARGRVNMLTHRTTSFSVLLKEEKTRVRLSEEIQKKRANRKLWAPLPDRPVTAQRQFCLW